MPGKFTALPATPAMHKVGITFFDVEAYAQKVIDLVEKTGRQFVALLHDGFKLYQAVTEKDFAAIFAALSDAKDNGESIIAAIKEVFGI